MNTRQSHPLIPREQTYVLDRKIVSIHSTDRDIKKWPYANHFEISLPETLSNVQSMRLVEIALPKSYVFSNEYQNTKLSFRLDMSANGCCANEYTITIPDGTYTPEQLTRTITYLMNEEVQDCSSCGCGRFVCAYNSVSNTFWFGNTKCKFSLLFNTKHQYTCLFPGQPDVFNHRARWGLPAYLGYDKRIYNSTLASNSGAATFDYEPSGNKLWITGANAQIVNIYIYCNICNLDIYGEEAIYMEIDRYNSMDELEPYSENSSGWFNNDYNGKVNSAFAKIPVTRNSFSQVYDSQNGLLTNISHYNPPIENISRLRFKFRYHDGRLVDFKCLPLSFSLEFNMLKDEQLRAAIVRVPPLYHL